MIGIHGTENMSCRSRYIQLDLRHTRRGTPDGRMGHSMRLGVRPLWVYGHGGGR